MQIDRFRCHTSEFLNVGCLWKNWGKSRFHTIDAQNAIEFLSCKHCSTAFHLNGHTLGFCPWNQKLENFVSSKVSLWESNG